jgi:hypothetical protein
MKRIAQIAAVLAVGSLGFFGCNREESGTTDTRTPGEKVGDAVGRGVNATTQGVSDATKATTQAAGNLATQASQVISPTGTGGAGVEGVRNLLEGVVTNAIDKNNYDDLIGYFSATDKQRLTAAKPDAAAMNAPIEQFKKSWRDKYGDTFRVMDNNTVFSPQFFALGGGTGGGQPTNATIAAGHGMPEVSVPLASEGGQYKLDVPDTMDAAQLHTNLMNALQDLNKDPATWPADKTQAYQLVSHRILMAVTSKS